MFPTRSRTDAGLAPLPRRRSVDGRQKGRAARADWLHHIALRVEPRRLRTTASANAATARSSVSGATGPTGPCWLTSMGRTARLATESTEIDQLAGSIVIGSTVARLLASTGAPTFGVALARPAIGSCST